MCFVPKGLSFGKGEGGGFSNYFSSESSLHAPELMKQTMIRSLIIKLGMLTGTVGFLMALSWSGTDHGEELQSVAERRSVSSTRAMASLSGTELGRSTNNPSESLKPPTSSASRENQPHIKPIDVNRSAAQELEALPGIGPVLAQRIVEHRKRFGAFQSIQDLDRVKGIGNKKIQALRPLIKGFTQPNAKQQG